MVAYRAERPQFLWRLRWTLFLWNSLARFVPGQCGSRPRRLRLFHHIQSFLWGRYAGSWFAFTFVIRTISYFLHRLLALKQVELAKGNVAFLSFDVLLGLLLSHCLGLISHGFCGNLLVGERYLRYLIKTLSAGMFLAIRKNRFNTTTCQNWGAASLSVIARIPIHALIYLYTFLERGKRYKLIFTILNHVSIPPMLMLRELIW